MEPRIRHRQPRLQFISGEEFFGKAKTVTGEFWWYEARQDDGTIKRIPLMPMLVSVQKTDGD